MSETRRCGVDHCPCQDGDPCHYEDHEGTKAMRLPCNCADTPPTMPTCRSEHLLTCPAYVHSVVARIEREPASRPGLVCAAEAVTARCIREVIERSWRDER